MAEERVELALVLSGGGARAAYQAGFLWGLAQRYPDLRIPILTGISAGAINAAYLASHPGGFREKAETLAQFWAGLTTERIFCVDSLTIAVNVVRWGTRLLIGRASRVIKARSLLDTRPLRSLLEDRLQPTDGGLPGIAHNLSQGELEALAITASRYATGQSITWVQGKHTPWEWAHRKSTACTLNLDHILASAALPLFFPAVRIDGHWHGDGGVMLTAPVSPAIHLGASRILAISTRCGRACEADEAFEGYPPPAQVLGALYNAAFLDAFDNDALRIQRINRLIAELPEERRHGLRPIELVLVRPSRDLGELANAYEPRLPRAFRHMTRGLGTQESESNDLLSLLMFQPEYLKRLIELGQEDAEARQDEIGAFIAR